ncbi:unnamed protein product [Menidia menidia]|uniref:(Atlantic silverside) hypothetical protein n=1 Tax=Menidia menidia TaxID=238744 RepID=A0A8S4BWW0_9TELE|nr:unnamed protein product [Menidia menidia]
MNNERKALYQSPSSSPRRLKMSDLSQVAVYSDSSDIYKNVFCNPAFELEGEREDRVEGFRTSSSTPEPVKPPAASLGRGLLRLHLMRLRCPGGWGLVVVSAAVLLLLAAVALALALIIIQIKGQDMKNQLLPTNTPSRQSSGTEPSKAFPTVPTNRRGLHSVATPYSTNIPPPETRCGGVMTDTEGSFSSPNHPFSYPPNSLFCGNVAPPTVNTNSSTVWVTFRSDGSIAGNGFVAQYKATLPGHSRELFRRRVHVRRWALFAARVGVRRSAKLPRPNRRSKLQPQTQGLETQDVCEFDYVEVHDGADVGAGSVLGRFCGATFPPDLTSSGPNMTVVFVADEGVADSGFNATYQAVSLQDSTGRVAQTSLPARRENAFSNSGCATGGMTVPTARMSTPVATPPILPSVLMELACFKPLQRLVCGMFLPQCSPQGGVLQPCRSVCSSAEQQCSQALDLFSFSWPFNCHLLPDSLNPMECSQP